MNDLEFREQYKRLKDVHPFKFESPEKMKTVWQFVNDFDLDWFTKIVDRIVMSSKGDLDIGDAATGERRARRSKQFADDVCAATKSWVGITDQGLDNTLEKYGAKSLVEAILKSREGNFK